MKLAILSGANPRSFQRGSVIRLLPGSWRLHVHGKIDSKLAMDVKVAESGFQFVIDDHLNLMLYDASNVEPYFIEAGTEKSITVIAERIKCHTE